LLSGSTYWATERRIGIDTMNNADNDAAQSHRQPAQFRYAYLRQWKRGGAERYDSSMAIYEQTL
jgi:hypothetical protein